MKRIHHFAAAIAMFARINDIMLLGLPPLQRREALGKLGPLRHRGHGRGGLEPQHNRQAARSKYMPHQGERECERRRVGGFHWVRRKAAKFA